MNKLDIYTQILRDTIRNDWEVEDVLLRALVLHTHSIALHPDVALDDVKRGVGEPRLVLAPLTRTHLAHLVASLWPKNEERGRDDFWFAQYGSITPYEVFDDVPYELRDRALAARRNIEEHGLVDELIEE